MEDDLGEFPPGWEQRVTSVGLPYFVDHVHRTTTVRFFVLAHLFSHYNCKMIVILELLARPSSQS